MSLFLRQLGWELFRLFARRRTYIGFGLFLAVEVLFYFLWTRERPAWEPSSSGLPAALMTTSRL